LLNNLAIYSIPRARVVGDIFQKSRDSTAKAGGQCRTKDLLTFVVLGIGEVMIGNRNIAIEV
jgi:hypothetical protein